MKVEHTSHYQEKVALEFRQTFNAFKEWLETSGAQLQPPSNQWEAIRYRARATEDTDEKKTSVHVAYKKRDGRITFMGSTFHHWNLYRTGKPLPDQPPPPLTEKKKPSTWQERVRKAIRERDGDAADLCWFCGKTMIGHDHTGEHAPTACACPFASR